MGNILGVPLGYAFKTAVTKENGIKEVLAHSYLERNYKRKRRLDVYDFYSTSDDNLEAIAFLIPQKEITLEYPREIKNEDDVDSIFFCGFHSNQDKLIVRISRNKKRMAAAWIILRLKDGRTFSLPSEKAYRVPIRIGPDTFSAGGLRIRCLHAMRKWRISFSGLLREQNSDFERIHRVYVKFSFIWTASSFLYDLNSDVPTKMFANFLSKENWTRSTPDLNRLSGKLDSYVQSGTLIGTYHIKGEEEQEMYLWGARKRSLELIPGGNTCSEQEYFAYLEEGEMLYFGSLILPNSDSNALQHGCIVQGNSLGGPVDECAISEGVMNDTIEFRRETFSWRAIFKSQDDTISLRSVDGCTSRISFTPVELNDQNGNGISIITTWSPTSSLLDAPKIYLQEIDTSRPSTRAIISLKDKDCRETSITGGKGSSLADLHQLRDMVVTFSVPKGIVVTTMAYMKFLRESCLEKDIASLETIAWKNVPFGLQEECNRVSALVSNVQLPVNMKHHIKIALTEELGENLENIRLAVRSSASGEDCEEMSAAGQMKTFLGVKGLDMVYEAVVKCWASQFDFLAIQYKRQNGQPLNSPMAVIIQEMVAADVAGVMFTCDPVTGNPDKVVITANYGIGESVVSATSEPDTIILTKNVNGHAQVENIQLGTKKNKTVMTDMGVKEEELPEDYSSKCSLGHDLAKQLANLGVQIEEAYGCLLDIEWAIKDNHLYLLQARPVTTFNKETDFECIHGNDSPLRTETEWTSIANFGEVFPDAMTPLGITSFLKHADLTFTRQFMKRYKMSIPWSPYYQSGFITIASHAMFSVYELHLRMFHGKHTHFTRMQSMSFFGRVLDDQEMLRKAARRNSYYKNVFSTLGIFYFFSDLLNAGKLLKSRRSVFPVGSKLEIPCSYSAKEVFIQICKQWISLYEMTLSQNECGVVSGVTGCLLAYGLLDQNGEMSSDAYSDYAYILSNCPEVESADIPNSIENLANVIINTEEAAGFHKMETKEALMWLERTDTEAGKLFQSFLKKHGHRCVKEFDIYSTPWGDDPTPLVKNIQATVAKGNLEKRKRAPESTAETIRNLKVPLNWKKRLIMRWAIPWARKGVSLREGGKSLLISVVDCMRHSYQHLAKQMVAEGRIPEENLLYFLTHLELHQLLQTRSPNLVQKAIRRRTLFPTMNKMVFPEISQGPPKPSEFNEVMSIPEGKLKMIGTPVSQGSATGTARVATSIEEAQFLQAGEILIAFSTDIGWTPYFPILGGVATELGGLISHGAVVAREYGLPCVVGVHGATLKFRTGDKVFIDGTKGVLCRLDE